MENHTNKSAFDGISPPMVDEVCRRQMKSCYAGMKLDEFDFIVSSKITYNR